MTATTVEFLLMGFLGSSLTKVIRVLSWLGKFKLTHYHKSAMLPIYQKKSYINTSGFEGSGSAQAKADRYIAGFTPPAANSPN